ncbi:MAG: hypothetical protein IJ113_06485 [Eggerthellaceae bacterium]|nr:hypothetical protein [Eggerthellaceae bacterium]
MTKTKDVQGLMFVGKDGEMKAAPVVVTVRVTKDATGATMSLAAEDIGMMLSVPLEPLADMLKVVEHEVD